VLVLSNFGAPEDLTILGVPIGRHLRPEDFLPQDGSIILAVATDLPWDALALRRLAARTAFGLARVGSVASHGSGDIAIAFSTAMESATAHADGGRLATAAFHAVAEATEEAILNALTQAETTVGRLGRVVPALPLDKTLALLRR
jgi:D-aminopeptidase